MAIQRVLCPLHVLHSRTHMHGTVPVYIIESGLTPLIKYWWPIIIKGLFLLQTLRHIHSNHPQHPGGDVMERWHGTLHSVPWELQKQPTFWRRVQVPEVGPAPIRHLCITPQRSPFHMEHCFFITFPVLKT